MEFKWVDFNDKDKLLPYFYSLTEGISEYNINLLFLWKHVYKTSYAINNNILYLIQTFRNHHYALMPICHRDLYEEAFTTIYQYIKSKEDKFTMYCVDKDFADFINEKFGDKLYAYEDRDSFDYIYLGEDLINLKGKKYHKKRNHINAFLNEFHGQYTYRKLNGSHFDDCCKLLKKWRETKGDSSYNQIQGEILGIKSLFEHMDEAMVKVAGIYIKDELEAFSIGSYLNDKKDMAVIHVEKANPHIRGLYPYINQQFLIHEFPNVKYINREEDLGIEGIRKAKMTYRPVDFAKKYNVMER